MKCNNCGTELRENATFCHVCGCPTNSGSSSNNPYVLVTGSKIDLDEKTEIYQKAKAYYYKVFYNMPFKSLLPIIGLKYINELIEKVESTEQKLYSFSNQENIINAILTDLISTKLFKILKKLYALRSGNIIFTIILILLIIVMVSISMAVSRVKSAFGF